MAFAVNVVRSFPRRSPLGFAMAFGAGQMATADIVTQKLFEHRSELDLQRVAGFTAYGTLQIGFAGHMIFNRMMPFLFPYSKTFSNKTLSEKLCDLRGILSVCGMTAVNEGMCIPFFSLPVFYLCNEVVQVGGTDSASGAYKKWKNNFIEDNTGNALLWCPATFINFFLMPLHLRVPFSASVSFIWCMGMSYFRGVGQAQPSKVAQAAQAALSAFHSEKTGTELLQTFKEFDTDKNNVLDAKEFSALLAALGITDGLVANAIFEAMDYDHNGTVDLAELVAGIGLLVGVAEPGHLISFIFQVMDLDHSGSLEREECRRAVRSMLVAREALIDFNAPETEDTLNMLIMMNSRYLRTDHLKPSRERAQQLRLDQLWRIHPQWASLPLGEVISAEAAEIVEGMFLDLDTEGSGKIPLFKFEMWVRSEHAHTFNLMNTFNMFHVKEREGARELEVKQRRQA
eukprot:gnl/TRDRNA2_/TRDRNA2_87290_c0_seq1.p1 gnl/TRDRNA2_/TRDRNA2_87290_c0~~gnl/TRDRNA2_/TRDRNA2_87290_c0_seq1.p1  ORF type:complete len:457 (-),score=71.99 gnl/TRDRNA2_/TRDRNA2_87290_c0_seq1:47-1417(-)